MAQTFHPVTPVECTPGSASAWTDVDLDSYVSGLGSDVTGVLLHFANNNSSSDYYAGMRKNGSTDDRRNKYLPAYRHCMGAIGVDSNHIFEIYVSDIAYIDVYIVGYTTTGVTFFDNGYDKSLSATGAWTDVDCASVAPNAIGLIFEVISSSTTNYSFGMRKNGSTDNRTNSISFRTVVGFIVGCDTSQICEGYIGNAVIDFYLVGYITDGAVFNTNATDISMSTTGSYADLTALPAGAKMGFVEVIGSSYYNWALRNKGDSEDLYYRVFYHSFAIVGCDSSGVMEGKISNTGCDYFVVGYAIGATSITEIMNEAIGVTESHVKRSYSNRLMAETVGISEGFVKRGYINQIINETIGVTESFLLDSYTILVKLMNETISVLDSMTRRAVFVKVFNETLSVLDSVYVWKIKNIFVYLKTRSRSVYLSVYSKTANLKFRSKNINLQEK